MNTKTHSRNTEALAAKTKLAAATLVAALLIALSAFGAAAGSSHESSVCSYKKSTVARYGHTFCPSDESPVTPTDTTPEDPMLGDQYV